MVVSFVFKEYLKGILCVSDCCQVGSQIPNRNLSVCCHFRLNGQHSAGYLENYVLHMKSCMGDSTIGRHLYPTDVKCTNIHVKETTCKFQPVPAHYN